MVFQDEQLFPHLDVAGNVGFGLRMRGDDAAPRAERVAELLELVGLAGFERRDVTTLSGGEASGWRSPARWHRRPACCCSTSR